MEEPLILTEKKERVFTLIFNRPDRRNALNPPMLSQSIEIVNRIREEREIRCLVIRGAGDKAFSSGYDMGDIPTSLTPEEAAALRIRSPFQGLLNVILDFPFPVIAMLNGHALGAGCDLAMCCDIRIAAELRLPESVRSDNGLGTSRGSIGF